ncbi:MAG: hypothetical protein OXG64_06420 [Chloroflexi bacterium]|nr:hypothetical protein [Chloroflexota bacterium]
MTAVDVPMDCPLFVQLVPKHTPPQHRAQREHRRDQDRQHRPQAWTLGAMVVVAAATVAGVVVGVLNLLGA